MSTFTLSESQKLTLCKLFEIKNGSEAANNLFSDIEYQMEESFLPPKGSRKVVAIEKAKLLEEIAKSSNQLSKLLRRLDDTIICDIDRHLGKELGKSYLSDSIMICDNPATCWDPISARKSAAIIRDEASFLAQDLRVNFGAGYMEKVIDALSVAWPSSIARPEINSASSKFVTYIAIIMEEESLDKIYKNIIRSRWYKNIRRQT